MIECKFENGKAAQLRHAVVDAVMMENGKILLVKRADHLHGGGQWAIPGGFIDHGETTVEAVMREVLEETGYTCAVKDLFTIIDQPNRRGDDRQNISFVYVVTPIQQVAQPDKKEVSDLRWFPLDQLPRQEEIAFDHMEIIWNYIDQYDAVALDRNAQKL